MENIPISSYAWWRFFSVPDTKPRHDTGKTTILRWELAKLDALISMNPSDRNFLKILLNRTETMTDIAF